jgi:lipopolysaccharide export system permease protein
MTLLNKYILKKFLVPFFASFSALCLLVLVSQIFDRLDQFLGEGVRLSQVIGYLLTSLPYQALSILPVACLLGTLFVVGTLVRTKEYIAGLAGGLAPEKFLGGILAAGFVISLAAFVMNETVVPPTSRHARMVYREKIRRVGEFQPHMYFYLTVAGAQGRMWNIKIFDQEKAEMQRVVVDTLAGGHLGMQIDAKRAVHTEGGWTFYDGEVRTYKSNGIDVGTQEPFAERFFAFEERPTDFVIQEPEAEEMNFKGLRDHIERLSTLGVPVRKLEVELMMKIAFPFSCFIVTLLGIPLGMSGHGNRAMGVAVAGALTLFYLGFVQFGKALAQRILPPLLGAWLGNIVFLAVAVLLWRRLRRTA